MEKTSKLPYLIIAGIAILAIISLIIIKINVPTFKLGTMLIIASVVVVILAGIGFAVKFLLLKDGNILEDKKLPSAITVEEAKEFCKLLIENSPYEDYTINEGTETEQLGKGTKSSVFTYYCKSSGYENKKYVVVLNMHYPNKINSVLVNPSATQILKAKIYSASYPEEEPIVKRVFSKNPILGTEVISEEVVKPKDENKEEKEKDIWMHL